MRTRCTCRSALTNVPSFSAKAAAGRTTSASCAVSREEDFVDDEEVQGLERLDHAVGVRVGGGRVVADDVRRPHPLPPRMVPGLGELQSLVGGQACSPRLSRTWPAPPRPEGLVSGQHVGQGAHVAGALHVVLAAEGIDAGALAADVSGEQGQVGAAHHSQRAVVVLGHAQPVEDQGPIGLGIEPRGGFEVGGGELPVIAATRSGVYSRTLSAKASNCSARAAMKSASCSRSRMITCAKPFSRATLVPGRTGSQWSAARASSVRARIDDDQPHALS